MTNTNILRKHHAFSLLTPYLSASVVIFLSTTLFLWPQLSQHAAFLASDTIFHYNRFFDIYSQLRHGSFNYFQTNYAFNQSGRIINAFYGPVFAFFNSLLLFVCKSWFRYQILSDFIIGFIGGLGFFQLLFKNKVKLWLALILIPLYLSAGSMPLWINGTSFMGGSAALAPWALQQGIRMIQNKNHPINWISLALTMSIVAQVHLISTVMFTVALIPFFIYGLILTQNIKSYLSNAVLAVIATFFLSLNVIAGLLVMKSNPTSLPVPGDLHLNASYITNLDNLRNHIMPILLILFVVQLLLALLINKKCKLNLFVTIVGFTFLWLSSQFFLWDKIQRKFSFLSTSFQAPYRLNVIAYPLLFLGIGLSLTYLFKQNKLSSKILNYGSILLLLVATTTSSQAFINYNQECAAAFKDPKRVIIYKWYARIPEDRKAIQNAALGSNLGILPKIVSNVQPDYLPLYTKKESGEVNLLYVHNVIDQENNFYHKVTKNGDLLLKWKSPSNKRNVVLPVVLYKFSRIKLNGKTITPHKTPIGNPIINVSKGKNTVAVSFTSPKYFKPMLLLAAISWIIILGSYIKKTIFSNEK